MIYKEGCVSLKKGKADYVKAETGDTIKDVVNIIKDRLIYMEDPRSSNNVVYGKAIVLDYADDILCIVDYNANRFDSSCYNTFLVDEYFAKCYNSYSKISIDSEIKVGDRAFWMFGFEILEKPRTPIFLLPERHFIMV